MAALMLNLSSVFQLKFSAKLRFWTSISATSPSREPLQAILKPMQKGITALILSILTVTSFAQIKMRPLDELINKEDLIGHLFKSGLVKRKKS